MVLENGVKSQNSKDEKVKGLVTGGGAALGTLANTNLVEKTVNVTENHNKDLEREKNLGEIEKVVDTYLDETREKYGKEPAIKDKLAHIDRVVKLVEKMAPGNKLAILAAKCHDLGRIPQFENLKGFLDGKILHHYFGEDLIARWLFQGKLKVTPELDMIRQVVMFHGRQRFIPFAPQMNAETSEVVDIISRADAIENGIIGFMEYGEREIDTDAKDFKKDKPDLDMKSLSQEVLDPYMDGKMFDKMKLVDTYGKYVVFACDLAIQGLIGKDREIAVAAAMLPCTGYNGKQYANTLEGYKDLFTRFVDPQYAGVCYERFLKAFHEGK